MINTTSISNLQQFSYEDKKIRTVTVEGEPWWVAKDVAELLGYAWNGTKTIQHVPDIWRGVESVSTPSGIQQMHILSENDLYFFLNRSDKEKALPFQMWVNGTIIPQIRRTGKYSVPTSAAPVESSPVIDDELLSERDAASLLAITEGTLKSWRYKGKAPKVTKVGNLVRYYRGDIQKFICESNGDNSSSRSVCQNATAAVGVPYNIADLAADVIERFSESMADLSDRNVQNGHWVLAKIFCYRIHTNDGWVSVEEVIRLLTSDHICSGADPAKRMACERWLKDLGIRLELDKDKNWIIWISNTHGAIARILDSSVWSKKWAGAFKDIPGVLHKDSMRFVGSPTSATGIPLKETSLCTEIIVRADAMKISPLDLIAPGKIEMINERYRLTKNTHITNTQLVYIVLHAISNAHLLRSPA